MGVSHLLDTHVFLWIVGQPDRLPVEVRTRLSDPENLLYVSAISALEIATKIRLGKLEVPGLVEVWSRRVGQVGARELPVTAEHAIFAGSMAWRHRDPFDRLIVAQATLEDMVVVTVDRAIGGLPVPRVLTWA